MPNIKDVARLANVSIGTVSNALTGNRAVSDDARQRILHAIDELGYQPDLVARSLVNRRSNTLAVVTAGLEYYGTSRTLVGIEERARELGYSLMLHVLHNPEQMEALSVLSDYSSRRVDGIIWAVPEIGENCAWIQEYKALIPTIFLFMQTRLNVSVVTVNHYAGALEATQHLIDQGRKKIAIIYGPSNWWVVKERINGWRDALTAAGQTPDQSLMVEGDWSAVSGERGLYELLKRSPDIDGILACNDQMALGVLRATHKLKCPVPQRLAVVGFDNIPESGFFSPSLTTVHQRHKDLGRIAIEKLVEIIDADLQQTQKMDHVFVNLIPELIIRESTDNIES